METSDANFAECDELDDVLARTDEKEVEKNTQHIATARLSWRKLARPSVVKLPPLRGRQRRLRASF